ncbi:unnamed protein product [Menidia menidia]|uniref:(Atlantic silverside) hypothetical protein n=1 Tax=Menidia menidia TaxID=238744 RepID=A0A8S4BB87_9TELE|nr:unnamed protein product [Menidia menidia]
MHRLFRTAGDRNAEHRAKRVWRGMGGAEEGKERGGEEEEEEEEEDAGDDVGLAQALVGLRVRARSKSGLRMEGHREPRWHKASGYLRVEEPLSDYTLEDEEVDLTKSVEEFQLPTEEDIQEKQNPFKPSSWRLGVRLEGARDSDRYLHRILH